MTVFNIIYLYKQFLRLGQNWPLSYFGAELEGDVRGVRPPKIRKAYVMQR